MDQNIAAPVTPEVSEPQRVSSPRLSKRRPKSGALPTPSIALHPLTPWAVTAAAVIVLALVILGIIPISLRSSRPWQAVSLTSGEMYFGHVVRQTLTTVTLRDVYYLQTTPSTQPGAASSDIALVRLGTELHGPTDEMRINRDHVLFMETLRDNAPVVRAITATRSSENPESSVAPVPVSEPSGDASRSAPEQ